MTINCNHVIRKCCDHIAQTVDLTAPQASVWLQIVELQPWELHTRVGGWMMAELMFLPIVARATLVQKKECFCLTCVYSQVVLCNIHTHSKPAVSGLTHCNPLDLPYLPVDTDSFQLCGSERTPVTACSISGTAVTWGFVGRPENVLEFGWCFVLYKLVWWRVEWNVNNFDILRSLNYFYVTLNVTE
jgi:hypothetical protein